jgi:hypothetical protein
MLGTSWVESGVLRRLGDAAMRDVPPADGFEKGRVVALLGKVDTTSRYVPDEPFVLGVIDRLKVRERRKTEFYNAGYPSFPYAEYDVERNYTPPFTLAMNNGVLAIVNRDYRIDDAPALGGGNGLRYRGFIHDATILVIGTMTGHGFVARAVSSESLPGYRARVQAGIDDTRFWGFLWTVFGSALPAYYLVSRGRRPRRGATSSGSRPLAE